ncbi:MAG: 2-succinyl-5-enolpyruvyl-6-hydroxy-3-cyclohexene-carboxylate synthase [Actinomycetota bacterium]|jgi:2-succinyl-5-enolpyruvyl-6-hydroxy-3-cyclohexene-1-carboxylate synthase
MSRPYAAPGQAVSSDVVSAAVTFCATLLDEWSMAGVSRVVLAPGSRSTPMALAIAADGRFDLQVVHDERAAAFMALGAAMAGPPVVLVCTSGTAAANFHPAVVEAGLSGQSIVVCTADRPPELRGVGSPQTIDQLRLYTTSVREFIDAPVPDAADADGWRPLARRALDAAVDGPVHLNLPFREPLVGDVDPLPAQIGHWDRSVPADEPVDVPAALLGSRGVIVMGGSSGVPPSRVLDLARGLGWPVLADPLSGARGASTVVAHADSLLRHVGFAADHRPEVVVRVGRPWASKVLTTWIVGSGAPVIQVGGPGVIDPDANVALRCSIDDLDRACRTGWSGALGTRWADTWERSWLEAEAAIERALEAELTTGPLTEPAVARAVADHLPRGGRLVVSSSMPVRDLEWFGGRRAAAIANRGANGIDGVLSTAVGLGLDGAPTTVLIGDMAFIHDANALWGVADRGVDLRVVVVDNAGGGIFSFLPQATELPEERFERLFGTPHTADVCAVAAAHGVPAHTVADRSGLVAALGEPGPWVCRVVSDRTANVAEHARLQAVAVAALG